MAVTLLLLPHELQVMKDRRFSPLLSSVSGLRQVLQVTYSTGVQVSETMGVEMRSGRPYRCIFEARLQSVSVEIVP